MLIPLNFLTFFNFFFCFQTKNYFDSDQKWDIKVPDMLLSGRKKSRIFYISKKRFWKSGAVVGMHGENFQKILATKKGREDVPDTFLVSYNHFRIPAFAKKRNGEPCNKNKWHQNRCKQSQNVIKNLFCFSVVATIKVWVSTKCPQTNVTSLNPPVQGLKKSKERWKTVFIFPDIQ